MTATEVVAERERRIREDPEYLAAVERDEAERAERARRLRESEKPLRQDLAAIGIKVDSVWDLHKIPNSRPTAIPVLLDHLARTYPDPILQGIGAALDHNSARGWWTELTTLYLRTRNDVVRDRIAAVLSNCATKTHYEQVLSFLRNEDLGETRIYFLRPVNRIGNRISPGQGRAVVASVADDPTLGKEADAILASRGRNE